MSILSLIGKTPARVTDNISAYYGYMNSDGADIRVKANNLGQIIVVIEDSHAKRLAFVFNHEDTESLNRFHIIMGNVFAYKYLIDEAPEKYTKGIKGGTTDVVEGADIELMVLANILGEIELYISTGEDKVSFIFRKDDHHIITRFRKEFSDLVKNISDLKLPKSLEPVEYVRV